jgi:hypothetical protein
MFYLYKRLFEAKTRFKKMLRVSESRNTLIQHILFALEENVIHRLFEHADPSKVPNPHQFRPPTGMPHWHCRQEEENPHLQTGDNKSKA